MISTDIPPVYKEIIDEKLGYVAPYDAHEFAKSCVDILGDRHMYRRIRDNVLIKARNRDWHTIFSETLERMFN